MSDLSKEKIATLRKMAEEQGIEGFEDMKRPELLEALGANDEAEESEESEQSESEESNEESNESEDQEAPAPVQKADLPAAPIGSKAARMKEFLHSEPKVRVFIPLAPGEKPGITQYVGLNGYPMYIRKGEYVEVPQSVAEVLEIKMKHKMSVEDHPERIGGDRPVKMSTF